MTERGEDTELCDSIDISSMLLDGETNPLLEDSQEVLWGVATVPPFVETSWVTLAVAVGQGSEEERQYSEHPCQGLPTYLPVLVL